MQGEGKGSGGQRTGRRTDREQREENREGHAGERGNRHIVKYSGITGTRSDWVFIEPQAPGGKNLSLILSVCSCQSSSVSLHGIRGS